MSRIDAVLARFRQRIFDREAATIQRLTDSWLAVERALEPQMTALAYEIEQLRAGGQVITQGKLVRLERYQQLLAQAEAQVAKYSGYAAGEIGAGQRAYWNDGFEYMDESMRLLLTTPQGIALPFNRVPTEAVETMIGLSGDGTPLGELLRRDYPETALRATDALLQGVAQGWNPRKTARALADAFAGNFQRALVVARTEQLRAFREVTAQTFARNADVLDGWYWSSALSATTCPICWGLHGSLHPVSEKLQDHVCGRCVAVPLTKTWDEIGKALDIDLSGTPETRVRVTDGDTLLRRKGAAFQRQVFAGQPGRFELWRDGMNLREMVGWTDDPDWGKSPVLRTLAELKEANKKTTHAVARNYLPNIDTDNYGVPDRSTRRITSGELQAFKSRVQTMPEEIRNLEPVEDEWRAVTRLNGSVIYPKDELNIGVIDRLEFSEMGSAWSKGNSIYLSPEFIGTPIQDHEYIHTLTYRNRVLRDALQTDYKTPYLYQHAQYAANQMGEQFTMTMTAFDPNRDRWIDNVLAIEGGRSRGEAAEQVDAVSDLLRSIGLW
jgi:hypothetical protein